MNADLANIWNNQLRRIFSEGPKYKQYAPIISKKKSGIFSNLIQFTEMWYNNDRDHEIISLTNLEMFSYLSN